MMKQFHTEKIQFSLLIIKEGRKEEGKERRRERGKGKGKKGREGRGDRRLWKRR